MARIKDLQSQLSVQHSNDVPELLRLIGRGSYGEVWLARLAEGSFCAAKIVRRESFTDERPYEREFNGIARFAPLSRTYESQLRILQVGRDDQNGFFFYLMELADDEQTGRLITPETYVPRTLRSDLRRCGRLPLDDCIRIGMGLSAALENLHQNGLIHRDVKPSNVVFVGGVPKLADIGLVTDSDVTVSFVGTEGFIPPEGPGSAQADIYSLGKVLYEISTGRDRQAFPELPTSAVDSAQGKRFLELNSIIARCCHGDLSQRYSSARQIYADLALLNRGRSVRLKAALRRNVKLALWTTAVVVVLFGLILGYFLFLAGRSSDTRLIVLKGKSQAKIEPQNQHTAETPAPAPLVFPPRSNAATPNQIDLGPFYNARLDSPWHSRQDPRLNLGKFPAGLIRFDNQLFDARGLIQLSSAQMETQRFSFPKRLTITAAPFKATRIHFLHGAVWPAPDGTHIGDYVLHYADHQQHVFPVVYGKDLRDWNIGSDPNTPAPRGKVAWSVWQGPYAFRIYETTWTNPVPAIDITSVEFVSQMSSSAPFLISVTVD